MKPLIQSILILIVLALLSAVCGCSSDSLSGCSDEEKVLARAFEAIRENDWEEYRQLSITSAEMALHRLGISPLKAKKGYIGSILLPAERLKAREQFDRAVTGGEDVIDFEESRFVAGELVAQGTGQLIQGGDYHFSVYSLRIEVDGSVVGTDEYWPEFILVRWKDEPRLLALVFE